MNQDSESRDEMRAEYDIRGGVRGKYLDHYTQSSMQITAVPGSEWILEITTTGAPGTSSVMLASYSPPYPSPTVQIGLLERIPAGR